MKKIFIVGFLLVSSLYNFSFADVANSESTKDTVKNDISTDSSKSESIKDETQSTVKEMTDDTNKDKSIEMKEEVKKEENSDKKVNLDQVIATYMHNGKKNEITLKHVADFAQERLNKKYEELSSQEIEQLKMNVVNSKLILLDAEKNNIDKDEEISKKLSLAKNELMIQKVMMNYIDSNFKEESVDELYTQMQENYKDRKAFDLQIAPLQDEEQAKKLLTTINKSGNKKSEFTKIIKSIFKSIDPKASDKNIDPEQFTVKDASVANEILTQEFEDQLLKMKKGDFGIVKANNNVFIVHLLNSKKAVLQPKDKIKNKLIIKVKNKLAFEYREKVMKDFDFQIISNIDSNKK